MELCQVFFHFILYLDLIRNNIRFIYYTIRFSLWCYFWVVVLIPLFWIFEICYVVLIKNTWENERNIWVFCVDENSRSRITGEHVLFMAFAWWFSPNFLETKFNFDPDAIKTSEIPFPTAPDNAIYFQSHKQDTIIPKNPDLIFDSQTAHKENFHFQIITNIQILLFGPEKESRKK